MLTDSLVPTRQVFITWTPVLTSNWSLWLLLPPPSVLVFSTCYLFFNLSSFSPLTSGSSPDLLICRHQMPPSFSAAFSNMGTLGCFSFSFLLILHTLPRTRLLLMTLRSLCSARSLSFQTALTAHYMSLKIKVQLMSIIFLPSLSH